ncbi:MAG: DUF1570 domain-containing protein [Planctomycetes bacterium]|nr:DUF1570 domain-containing protein [Planctomycetota bacterium]
MLALLMLSAAASLQTGNRPLDRVVLTDGTRLEGRVVHENEARLVLRQGSRERVLDRAEIQSADSRLAAWREALDRWNRLDREDATRIADIGTFAQRLGLPEEARVFALRAIAVDPDNAVARDLLGHEKKGKDWTFREGTRRWTWKERVEKAAAWRDGWTLETTHWVLRTNLPLLAATNAILDLENVYAIFYAELAPVVGAYHLDAPMRAQIHADTASFPEGSGSRGFYDREARLLAVGAAPELDRGLVVHEAVHQLLAENAYHARGAKGAISPWLDEGLADWFRAVIAGPPGRFAFQPEGLDSRHVRAHAHARERYKLSRVLTFDSGDFHASSRQDLKYAQAYTFVHFLMSGDGGRYRARFDDFLRSAWSGKGSSTDLEAALGAKVDAIEKAWTAWVLERAK